MTSTDRDRRRAGLVLSLALISWLPVWSTQAADHPPGAAMPFEESPKAITDAQTTLQPTALVREEAPAQASWVDDIANALGFYFKANYPADDFAPYLRKLTLVKDALGRGDRHTVKVEMGAFFQLLTHRSHGISAPAAEELADFARMVLAVQGHGIVFSRSKPERYGATGPRAEAATQRDGTQSVENRQESSYVD